MRKVSLFCVLLLVNIGVMVVWLMYHSGIIPDHGYTPKTNLAETAFSHINDSTIVAPGYTIPGEGMAEEVNHSKTWISFAEGVGRLGNWMFQYASTYGIALQNGYQCVLSRNNQLRGIFSGIDAVAIDSPKMEKLVKFEDGQKTFSPELMNHSEARNLGLCCYLQSWRYFDGYENEIRKQFKFKEDISHKVQDILKSFKAAYMQQKVLQDIIPITFIGIHVRRGDFLIKSRLSKGYKVASKEYIIRAMDYYKAKFRNILFVMASDDLRWCHHNFQNAVKTSEIFLSPGLESYEDLCLLSLCNHSIITTGSFGWWSGWLTGGSVVYYSQRPPNKHSAEYQNQYNRYPPTWVPIQ